MKETSSTTLKLTTVLLSELVDTKLTFGRKFVSTTDLNHFPSAGKTIKWTHFDIIKHGIAMKMDNMVDLTTRRNHSCRVSVEGIAADQANFFGRGTNPLENGVITKVNSKTVELLKALVDLFADLTEL